MLADGTAENLGDLVGLDHDDAAQSLAVARLAREHGITHLHAHFASVATTVARAASLLTGIPYSFTTHAKDIFHDSVVTADLARKTADADHVVAISDFNRDYLRRRLGPVLAERIHVVRNGLELDRFPTVRGAPQAGSRDCSPSAASSRRRVSPTSSPPSHSSGSPGGTFDFDLVGTGPLEAEPHEQITELGLADIVTMHGALTQREVTAMIDDHTALVAPFVPGSDGNVDGLPTVLLEGMAAGIPCVAGGVTAVPEIVIDGRTGWLVDGTDPDAIASAVAEVIGLTAHDPQSLRRITDAARDRVADLHDSRRQARALADLIDRPADDVDQPLEELEVAS